MCAAMIGLAGCGSSAASAPVDDPSPTHTLRGPPTPWAAMSPEERSNWMMEEVLPRMTTLFQAHDGTRYASMSCSTCHGDDARARGFRMPSSSLPALYPTGTPEQQQMVREYPEMVRFMFGRVMPATQTLLGAAPYDPEAGTGLSCFTCHPRAGDEGTTPIRLGADRLTSVRPESVSGPSPTTIAITSPRSRRTMD
jgi:cytochrome c553